jgi:glutaredoxin-like protein NrdH
VDPLKLKKDYFMSQVTVYTLPSCVQCDSTKRYLKRELIDFVEVKLQDDPQAYEMVMAKGFTQAPIVMAGERMWSGFRMDELKLLKAA